MKSLFRQTTKTLAMNPVARAVARVKLDKSIKGMQTRIFMLKQGEHVPADVMVMSQLITVFLVACDRAGYDQPSNVRGALSALTQCSERKFTWHTIDAISIDQALSVIAVTFPTLPAADVSAAWELVCRG